METASVLKNTDVKQKVQLVKGEFTPSEALHIVSDLIDRKINFHKVQRLQIWEGDHKCETDLLNGRIKELMEEKRMAREFIKKLATEGKSLKIDGVLQISLAD